MSPTSPKPPAAPVAEPEALVTVGVWVADVPSRAIPVAGLLADQPDLAEAELSEQDWQAALDAYSKSPRP